MKKSFCESMVQNIDFLDKHIFLTGDLGFMALEPLRAKMGKHFINAGVAEQNMVSVAAGLARGNFRPWVYSIAPFIFARTFEQIRNDVCLHNLPVVLVGNGGGYGYGVMGATHHAIEDYGVLLSQKNLKVYIPAFDEDLERIIPLLISIKHPAYLRLGLANQIDKTFSIPSYSAWRKLEHGKNWTVLVVGPLVGDLWRAIRALNSNEKPNLWLLSELPHENLPLEFLRDLQEAPNLLVIEEHVDTGGAGQSLASQLLKAGILLNRFETRTALGYPSKRYGSQQFHQKECQLDSKSIITFLRQEVIEI